MRLQLMNKTTSSIGGQRYALAGCQARPVRHGLPEPRAPAAFNKTVPTLMHPIHHPPSVSGWTDGRTGDTPANAATRLGQESLGC